MPSGSTRAGKATTASQNTLAYLTRTDKQDVATSLLEAGLADDGEGYNLFLAVRALLDRKENIGKKASELNQEAQAKLNDVKRKALERELVPISEARRLASAFGSMVSQVVEDSDLPMESQNLLMERMGEAAREAFGQDEG